ncbi:hypothetical protein CBR_g31867 [Chara braunii]|uniref:Amidase domain-containing protein n=1 Tax=Chara braunii TaxID=69332 RepID=A0A388LFV9_CHABU|nr:hypothetical protein CBR_g31867 [Chara braunii]|eukprot:GBG81194.1 hypothetical protein CBR_g31867 [Chara braunii]
MCRITAPQIPRAAACYGESNLAVTAKLMSYIVAPNFIGLPAITVPVGHDRDGLPIGIQIIGRPWAEATLLQVAAALEGLCAPQNKGPNVFYDMLGQ